MDLMNTAREFVMGLPEALQGAGVFLVSFIPFVEGEGAAVIGMLAGISPWLAAPVAALGNIVVVALLVYAAHGIRGAVLNRRAARRSEAAGTYGGPALAAAGHTPETPSRALMRERFERWGVPGLSLIGPMIFIPGHAAAPAMVSFGASKAYVMLWQVVSIVLYTAVASALMGFVLVQTGALG